jgi:hypothetical protein
LLVDELYSTQFNMLASTWSEPNGKGTRTDGATTPNDLNPVQNRELASRQKIRLAPQGGRGRTGRPEALPAAAAPDGRQPQQCQHPGSGPM